MDQRDIRRLVTSEITGLHTNEEKYNPYSWYKEMRAKSPVYFDQKQGVWNVFLYEDVNRVISDKDVFSSKRFQQSRPFHSIINTDPPEHTRLRSLVSHAFTPKMIAGWEPRIRAIATELLDKVSGQTHMDLVEDFSYPLPVMVIAELLGIPTSDRKQFKEWSDIVVSGPSSTADIQETIDRRDKAIKELMEYFSQIIEEKRKNLKEDMISTLIKAEENEGKLSSEELFGFCITLLIAGNETTTNLISNAVYCFLENQTIWEELKRDPGLIPHAVEETLRYRSPVQAIPRRAKTDAEIGGFHIKPGQIVLAWIGSANRDEQKFTDPDEFQLRRNPNPHLSFGKGIHFCLGAPLARLEAKIALEEFLKRYSSIALKEGYQLDPVNSNLLYGLKSLHIAVS
ncbi:MULTISPECIES: cytochrome P450 [Thermoactinomyces]|jgi:cytochrome P450|uniref:Cytochrome P450 n=1 Tax=Thermoactinomyces daqus TaxID=1329516 RepID=A0A7W2AH65_9BACL|nr:MULTISPECIES: cytochrome P450 [Thermoactinomyces]MBA4541528.1 cytochrome P450 [Thermoactinomyces daqus]MBH8597006.1 cytochrome P450 [Thermoactinomyces sp. CICC 10523]MBH8603782.1 cytochrome P450 [Thermoactinomyces sp. CICC 10522]MBH8607582.1 cytochrome P450 [Thermoactinomyces sp. CICC 10521]